LADSRRSGAQEAFVGDAQPADVSHAMGDTIATSNMLFATYNPVNPTGCCTARCRAVASGIAARRCRRRRASGIPRGLAPALLARSAGAGVIGFV